MATSLPRPFMHVMVNPVLSTIPIRRVRNTLFSFPKIRRTKHLAVVGLFTFIGVAGFTYSWAGEGDQARWDNKYATEAFLFGQEPIPFLKKHVHLLPQGAALDLAMGEGRNGVYLATKGFQVTGVDISATGLKKAQALAAKHGVKITTVVADLDQYTLPPDTYDVILCAYYLQRDLFPQIAAALKPGGMAVIETYTVDHLQYRPNFTKDFLLKRNELLTLLPDLRVLRYQEVDTGEEAYASLLAQKPLQPPK